MKLSKIYCIFICVLWSFERLQNNSISEILLFREPIFASWRVISPPLRMYFTTSTVTQSKSIQISDGAIKSGNEFCLRGKWRKVVSELRCGRILNLEDEKNGQKGWWMC